MVKRILVGIIRLSRYIIPIIFEILEAILFMCESHFKCLCIVNPKKLNLSADSILIFSFSILGLLIFQRYMKYMYHEFGFFYVD